MFCPHMRGPHKEMLPSDLDTQFNIHLMGLAFLGQCIVLDNGFQLTLKKVLGLQQLENRISETVAHRSELLSGVLGRSSYFTLL